MKLWILAPIFVLAMGCSGGTKDTPAPDKGNPGPDVAAKSKEPTKDDLAATKEQEKFNDSVFKVPPYPGAEIMKFTSIEMDSDVSHSFGRHYRTSDSVDKVAEFYMAEGAKVGKVDPDTMMNKPGALMRVVFVQIGPKEKLQVQAMNIPKGNYSDISVHLTTLKN